MLLADHNRHTLLADRNRDTIRGMLEWMMRLL